MNSEDEELLVRTMTAKNNKNKSIKAKIGLLNFHATLPFNKVQKYAKMPTQGSWRSVGYDLYSVENTSILPNTQKLIPTGIACNLPRKMFGLIKDRSSIITKRELKTQAGVIDEDSSLASELSEQKKDKSASVIE